MKCQIVLIQGERDIVIEQMQIAQRKKEFVGRELTKVSGDAHGLVQWDMDSIEVRINKYDDMVTDYKEKIRFLTIEIEAMQKGDV